MKRQLLAAFLCVAAGPALAQVPRMPDSNHDGWLGKGERLMMRQTRARGG